MSLDNDVQLAQTFDEIDKSVLSSFTHIIGFDLGHGEFSLFQVSDEQNDSAKCIEINNKKSQITAIAVKDTGEILVGNKAITTYDEAVITVGFKRKPGENPNLDRLVGLFFAGVLRSALAERKVSLSNKTLILVGCPSEWTREQQRGYQAILQEAISDLPCETKPKVAVVPESRAAIQCARQSGQFSIDELQAGTVSLLDFGSSTVDSTLLQSGQDLHDKDDGCDLGAFLLDELIVCDVLQRQDEATRARICDAMRYRASNLGRCLLRAREVKEAYFDMPEFKEKRLLAKGTVDIESHDGDIDYMDVRLTMGQLRALIEETPLLYIEESAHSWDIPKDLLFFPCPDYSHLPYKDALMRFSEKVRGQMEQKREAGKVSKVLLTGGAARMDLVKTIVESSFPDVIHARMSAPETSVAEGLALRGRAEVMCARFTHDMRNQFSTGLTAMLQEETLRFYHLTSDSVVDAAIREVIDVEIQKACNNRMQGSDLATSCAGEVGYWIDDGNLKVHVISAAEKWFTTSTIDKVNDSLNALAAKHSIPAVTIGGETALSMARSIETTSIENSLKRGLKGPDVTRAVYESMDIIDKIINLLGFWDLGSLSPIQRGKLRDEIRSRLHKGLMETLQGQSDLARKLQTSLQSDIERDVERIIALETCAYL